MRPLSTSSSAFGAWREHGCRFRTRALGRTSSAAALLVALGDERVADRGVKLLFHGASLYRRGDVNARECAALNAKLSKANDTMIARLVERAFAGPRFPGEHGAEEADWEVVEGLCLGATPDPAGTAPARIQTLATALGQTIDNAIGELDRTSLGHIYARLFQIDRPISGKLTRTLALIDRVGEPRAASPDAPGTACLPASEPTPFASPAGELAPETLLRHVLVLGDAAAATPLCLAPLVTALARAPRGQVGPVLVLNPDPELRAALHTVVREQLQVLDPHRIMLDLMASNHSLAPALEAGQWMTAATSILRRTLDLVPGSPARFLLDVSGRAVDPAVREGTLLALSVTGFVLLLTSRYSPLPDCWLPECDAHREISLDLLDRARCADGKPGPNILALVTWVLSADLGYVPARIPEAAFGTIGRWGTEERELVQGLRDGAEALSAGGDHSRAVLAVAMAIAAPFSVSATRASLYFGCETGLNPGEALDLTTLISVVRDARFLLFEPKDDASDGLVAAGLKQLFMEAVLDRPPSGGTLRDAPLCAYVARNFERYVTALDLAFLDRARSAGGFAVLSSKSVSAIEHALGGGVGRENISPVLWSGAGTKLLLRSTDPRTQELARGLAPRRPGHPDLLEVRPLAGLAPWSGAGPENVDPVGPPEEAGFVPPGIRTRRGETT